MSAALLGLRLRHVDLLHATVPVEQQIQQTAEHGGYAGPPKAAWTRTRRVHAAPSPTRGRIRR
ncbi:hypothetical protein HNR06_003169 [Nocardiopsis arvandica]|uniref:Uncharacterized protein n=1 Tax=Nocardiopsis sinuspersici TaxID=501010 RepID=A0A7Z0BKV9_9ACTN|nr:hypothetical protein [Nocardiopsis sinuspersici]NYH53580.1 hypothetical protein [Nocardiopsis sinuspersici]